MDRLNKIVEAVCEEECYIFKTDKAVSHIEVGL